MVNKKTIALIVRNLAILVGVVLPICLLLIWVALILTGGYGEWKDGPNLQAGLYWFILSVFPLLIAGLLHQLIVLFLPQTWDCRRRRRLGLALIPMIPLSLAAFGSFLIILVPPVTVAVTLGFIVYGFFLKFPTDRALEN
jgi:hypothetical protein